jgi:putative heme-binding domain-containing protein
MFVRLVVAVLLGCCLVAGLRKTRAADVDEKTALAVETLLRLPATELDRNPKLKETVLRVLERTRGTASFVKLVEHFALPDQSAGLLDVIAAQPAGVGGPGAEAMRLLLAGPPEPLRHALEGTNTNVALKVIEALGNTGDKRAVPLLLPVLGDQARELSLRREAVRASAKTADGARELLKLAREERLSADLRFTAGTALAPAAWPDIKAEATKVFPPVQGRNASPLPPLAELLKMKGDVANGARLYTNAIPGCSGCHVVDGRGTELGPNLSEIGTKLGKDALYEAILEPSAGISFGYEAYNITLKNGDEVYGLVASDSAEEVVVKAVGGLMTPVKKADIVSRQPSKLSIMPTGLQAAMTTQELVDLVEYLASLKKH